MSKRRVVVTGLGALTPIGNTAKEYWQGLMNGVSGAAPITRFDASKFKTQFACEVKNFDIGAFIDRKEARKMDPFCHYAVVTSDEAMADSGLQPGDYDPTKFGVILGSGIGGLLTFQEEVRDFYKGDGTPRFNPFFIPKMIIDIASGHVSIKYGLRGPNYSTVSACATSSNCIADAFMLIRNGIADLMLAGGAEAAVVEAGIGGFNAMKALSTRNDDPSTASRPFDVDRDGFVLGEGAGVLVLEEYEHAKARGARIYGELCGVGMTADAYHITAPHPDGDGAHGVMKQCLDQAGILPSEVDYVNVHGTSTPLGDIAETKAIKRLFGDHAHKLNISSTKSMTGHLLGAAGAIEAIASVLSIYHGVVPPTINHFTDDPECDLNYTFHTAVKRDVRVAISNTFGFGGHNASVVFRKLD
ncbi:MAG: beta-ketoacyl-ACP synthase II [Bacteroidetes bacterium]|nr:beta-ketoacyl-ACP synthase II [Bacteroidota bacterium]MBL0015174.1 beta-ketoacyl-ACP synthase II [Bacteroidota bacterium]MBP6641229.1 beta-ketoacyl-ACP synthase II [Bacteroidia bacterium]MBP6722624.1 beta-ketoacyl-ACP synthase II [Bacteroidia bacterium]